MSIAQKGLARERDWGAYAAVPPPPTAPLPRATAPALPIDRPLELDQELETIAPRPAGHEFDAELDATELDERDRPTTTWTARGRRLSRSNIVIRSRRMCYAGRRVLLAVHLIDSQPVALFGLVRTCEYDGEGMYLISLDFLPPPERPEVREWLKERGQ